MHRNSAHVDSGSGSVYAVFRPAVMSRQGLTLGAGSGQCRNSDFDAPLKACRDSLSPSIHLPAPGHLERLSASFTLAERRLVQGAVGHRPRSRQAGGACRSEDKEASTAGGLTGAMGGAHLHAQMAQAYSRWHSSKAAPVSASFMTSGRSLHSGQFLCKGCSTTSGMEEHERAQIVREGFRVQDGR